MIRLKYNTTMAVLCLIMFAVIMFCCSCGTLRKSSHSLQENKDSVITHRQDSVSVKKDQLVSTKDSTADYHRKITIELDGTNYLPGDGNVNAADYIPADSISDIKKKPVKPIIFFVPEAGSGKPVTIDLGGNRPSKILLEESGHYQVRDSSGITHVDSNRITRADSSSDHTQRKQAGSSKYRDGTPALLLSITLLIGTIYLLFFRRKRN